MSLRRLPSVVVLQLVAGSILCVPFVLMTRTTVDDASARLNAATEVEARVARVSDRIGLAAALASESTATSASIVLSALPEPIAAMITTDVEESLVQTRNAVDDLIDRPDNGSYGDDVDAIRADVDAGRLEHNDAIGALLDVGAALDLDMHAELQQLSQAIGRMSGGDQIAGNLDAARWSVELSVLVSDATARWGGLLSPTDPPTAAEAEGFIGTVARWRDAQNVLDVTLSGESELAQTWRSLHDSESHQSVENAFTDAVASFAETPPPIAEAVGDTDDRIELTPELIADLQVVDEMVSALEDVVTASYSLAEDAIAEVTEENAALQADASSQRTRATMLFVASIALVLVVAGALVALVVRPLRQLASVASGLSRGVLEDRAPVAGPSELRTTASALNQTLDALERAELRTNALADERPLTDLVDNPASGPLASSIDAAVVRLSDLMAEREALRERLEHAAGHDRLTGLANRDTVIAQLEQILDERKADQLTCALLYLDLDEFKSINDEFGHHVGDQLLRITADRLRDCLGQLDIGGRIGGDEIVVVASTVVDADDALGRAERIRLALSEPFMVDGASLQPSVSVGVSIADRADIGADRLIIEADLALYRAKELGRGRVELCDDDLRQASLELADLGHGINRAIVDDELELHYQPIADPRSGRLLAIEALVRWHRDGVIVEPDDFIPHAERSHQIVAIDRWVLRTAAQQAAAWDDEPELGDVPIAINLSGRSLSNPELVREVGEILQATGVAPTRLMVEVNDNSIVDDVDSMVDQIIGLRAAGVRIALNNFGTGSMSLDTLRRFDIDVIKINQSFVSQLHEATDRSLVQLMIQTGHLLDAEVVAIGVETTAQQDLLLELGIDAIQGFLSAMPSSPDQLLRGLTANAP